MILLRIHGNAYTKDIQCEDEVDAEALAWEHLGRGVRYGNRIYPNTSIVFCEILKNNDGEDDGA